MPVLASVCDLAVYWDPCQYWPLSVIWQCNGIHASTVLCLRFGSVLGSMPVLASVCSLAMYWDPCQYRPLSAIWQCNGIHASTGPSAIWLCTGIHASTGLCLQFGYVVGSMPVLSSVCDLAMYWDPCQYWPLSAVWLCSGIHASTVLCLRFGYVLALRRFGYVLGSMPLLASVCSLVVYWDPCQYWPVCNLAVYWDPCQYWPVCSLAMYWDPCQYWPLSAIWLCTGIHASTVLCL